jgi:shikimate kinase
MLIFIVGYMGAGKTTLGKLLADGLNYKFYDLDEMIEISSGYSIRGYFEKFGEASFRQKEREILHSHLEDLNTIIAAGGGTPCYADNMALMNQKGITVFIDTPFETIMKRLAGKKDRHPLLINIHPDQLPVFIEEHMKTRRAFYSKAKIRIDGDEVNPDHLIEAVRFRLASER